MERRSWFKKIGIAVVGLSGIAALSAFKHGGHGFGHGPERMERMLGAHLEDVLDDVEATPEQRQKILAVKERLLEKGKALHGARREGMKALLAEWEAASPDRGAVHARIDARAGEMQAFAHDAADGLLEVHAILTPAQREKLAKKWRRRVER